MGLYLVGLFYIISFRYEMKFFLIKNFGRFFFFRGDFKILFTYFFKRAKFFGKYDLFFIFFSG